MMSDFVLVFLFILLMWPVSWDIMSDDGNGIILGHPSWIGKEKVKVGGMGAHGNKNDSFSVV